MGETQYFNSKPDAAAAKAAALSALRQDARRDVTSERCIPEGMRCSGSIVAKSDFVLCGVVEANAIFQSRQVKAAWKFCEGRKVRRGAIVCRLEGHARGMLACERTALNYLSLLSGIATRSALFSEKYGRGRISATRKTLPLLAHSQKRAVRIGGCLAHRLNLADGILVKDNHVAALRKGRRAGEARAIEIACGAFGRGAFVEVEVSSLQSALSAAEAGAGALLVDNVSPEKLRRIAREARKASPRIMIEASGGITLENAGKYLAAGADFASTSELTMRITPANLSLEIDSF